MKIDFRRYEDTEWGISYSRRRFGLGHIWVNLGRYVIHIQSRWLP